MLDAFGVGFTVAGIVDVLAVSALNRNITGQKARQGCNRQAEEIIYSTEFGPASQLGLALETAQVLHASHRRVLVRDGPVKDRLPQAGLRERAAARAAGPWHCSLLTGTVSVVRTRQAPTEGILLTRLR